VVVMDDESRENEGDLIMAAEFCTQEKMAFIVRHSSGYVCCPMHPDLIDHLQLPPMVLNPTDPLKTSYTISLDFAHGTTTGISAHDRSLTARNLANASSLKPSDFHRPGHILPLRANANGVLSRRGHTEAAVDLCRLAGLNPVGVICELVRDEDGLMMRRDDCIKFCKVHGLKICTIEAMVEYRRLINL